MTSFTRGDDRDVFLTEDGTIADRWVGAGMQPWLAADQQRLFEVWLSGRSGRLLRSIPKSQNKGLIVQPEPVEFTMQGQGD